ncbi:hypothetical protein [Picosynechococcus sp. NKBG15041c]|uniref:hypothetical protein n=1 Tax=Picosynechococcus sp. NKBG15041c TaxID=1407650 RepID=UPI00046752DE|nr:hypothetical protein [Picosynechococcus sp. NKBG15041c]
MLKKLLYAAAIGASVVTLFTPSARAERCAIYTEGYSSTYETSNCYFPNGGGVFQNGTWEVSIAPVGGDGVGYWYKGRNRQNGSFLRLEGNEIQGITERRRYVFRNGDYSYIVTIRPSEPNTIRLEVYQGSTVILNQLLSRVGDLQAAENNIW